MSAPLADEELDDVSKVVENLDSIMKGLTSKDEDERREAMERSEKFLAEREKQKKAKSETEGCHVAKDRTVVNKTEECAELEAYRKAVEADAADRAARRRSREQNATRLKDEGNTAFKGGNYELAVAKYSEGLEEMPWNTALYTNRAQAYCKLGDHQKAVEDCDKALEIDDRCIKALVHRGNSQVSLEKFDEAIKSYERAIKVAPLKQEKTIKGYIEKAEEAREAAIKEKTALDSQSRGELESTTVLEMLKVLSRDELPKQHILEAARTLALSIGSDIQRTLFRAQDGFYTLLHNKYFEERDPDVVQSVLDCIYAVCTGDKQNENTLLSIKTIGDVFGDLLMSTCPVVTSSAAALIHILSMNVHSRTRLIAIMSKSRLFHGLVAVIDYCSAGTTNAVETFANFALEKGFRGLMSSPINETLVPALDKLVVSLTRP
jgi:tetratricopeptide (TPR) repeat protein